MTDRSHERLLREETLLKRRPWYLLAAGLLTLSAFTREPLVLLCALLTLVIGLVPEIWYRRGFHRLTIRQQAHPPALIFGAEGVLTISVENYKLLPLPWLEIETELPASLTPLNARSAPSHKDERALLRSTFALWPFQRVTRRYRFRCAQRGLHTLGPLQLRSSDPFGWLLREEQRDITASLLVYPPVVPLAAFGLASRAPFGLQTTPRRLLEDPLRFAGVRPYQPGDDPRMLHWKASARSGQLSTKVFDPSYEPRLLLVLNVTTFREAWMGIDSDLQELLISLTASLAVWGLEAGYQVGLLANSLLAPWPEETQVADGERSLLRGPGATYYARASLPFGRGAEQRTALLTTLARLLPYLGSPLDPLLEAEMPQLLPGTTLLLLSAADMLQESTLEILLAVQRHGHAVHLVLVGGDIAPALLERCTLPIHHLRGRELWHELLETAGTVEAAHSRAAGTPLELQLA
jgi:uncharacterized protein (DUF58 family)